MEGLIAFVLCVVIAIVILAAITIIRQLIALFTPGIAFILLVIGVIIGFVVAIKNTIVVFKRVYSRK